MLQLLLLLPLVYCAWERFFVIVLENADYSDVLQSRYMGNTLLSKGRLLTNYHGVTHPSQQNYFAMTTGTYHFLNFDFTKDVGDYSIVDELEAANVSWKTYQENYPGGCSRVSTADPVGDMFLYQRKHNPFISLTRISGNATRCANIVNAKQLKQDIVTNSVPQYVFYTPNMFNDGHDTSIEFADNWLQSFLEPLLANPAFANTVFLITHDENDDNFDFSNNQVYSLLVGGPIPPQTRDDNKYDHYSQITFVRERWNLPRYAADVKSEAFNLTSEYKH